MYIPGGGSTPPFQLSASSVLSFQSSLRCQRHGEAKPNTRILFTANLSWIHHLVVIMEMHRPAAADAYRHPLFVSSSNKSERYHPVQDPLLQTGPNICSMHQMKVVIQDCHKVIHLLLHINNHIIIHLVIITKIQMIYI